MFATRRVLVLTVALMRKVPGDAAQTMPCAGVGCFQLFFEEAASDSALRVGPPTRGLVMVNSIAEVVGPEAWLGVPSPRTMGFAR